MNLCNSIHACLDYVGDGEVQLHRHIYNKHMDNHGLACKIFYICDTNEKNFEMENHE